MGGRGRLGGGGRLDGGEIDFSATSWLSIDQLKLGLTWVILLCKTGDSHNFVISFFWNISKMLVEVCIFKGQVLFKDEQRYFRK